MPLNKSSLTNILVISLTNIGDVVLTLPVIDALRMECPRARLSLVIGPKAVSLFDGHPGFHRIEVYDKHQSLRDKIRWIRHLKEERFDCVIDLRHTLIPLLLGSRYHTRFFRSKNHEPQTHRRITHFSLLRELIPGGSQISPRFAIHISLTVQDKVRQLWRLSRSEPFVVLAPGAAAPEKRWKVEEFIRLAARLQADFQRKIVLVGHSSDVALSRQVEEKLGGYVLNLTGQTTLLELAAIFQEAELAVVNDSGPMHLASYLNCPLVALFGSTDPVLYGPWSDSKVCIDRMEDRTYQDVLNRLNFEAGALKLL